jgi:hypothetical protein
VYIAAGVSIAIIVVVASLGSSLNATLTSVQTALKQKCPRIFRAANAFARRMARRSTAAPPMSLVGRHLESSGQCFSEMASKKRSAA